MYGWWVGELNSLIGIVPKEYLTTAFEVEEWWSPGIRTIANEFVAHAFVSLWRMRLASEVAFLHFQSDAKDSPLKEDESGIVFPKLRDCVSYD